MRDKHIKTQVCRFFKEGRCRFPENKCWGSHQTETTTNEKQPTNQKVEENITCYDCNTVFKSKKVLMEHKSQKHPEKMKLCTNAENCAINKCWFRHISREHKESETNQIEEESNNEWLNEGLDNETVDFREAPTKQKPPLINK